MLLFSCCFGDFFLQDWVLSREYGYGRVVSSKKHPDLNDEVFATIKLAKPRDESIGDLMMTCRESELEFRFCFVLFCFRSFFFSRRRIWCLWRGYTQRCTKKPEKPRNPEYFVCFHHFHFCDPKSISPGLHSAFFSFFLPFGLDLAGEKKIVESRKKQKKKKKSGQKPMN
jgi:hypothetical protein